MNVYITNLTIIHRSSFYIRGKDFVAVYVRGMVFDYIVIGFFSLSGIQSIITRVCL